MRCFESLAVKMLWVICILEDNIHYARQPIGVIPVDVRNTIRNKDQYKYMKLDL